MANEPRFCAVEQHNVRYSVRDNVRPLTIKTFCFAVAHFCCVGNFTYYLVNITLYCFVTVSLKELFRLFFQSIVDFKSYKRNDIKGSTNRSVAWKLANKPNWANVLTARWPIAGLQVTSRRPCWWSRTKAFLSAGKWTLFWCKFSRKISFVLTTNMAALSRGCKPRMCRATHCGRKHFNT